MKCHCGNPVPRLSASVFLPQLAFYFFSSPALPLHSLLFHWLLYSSACTWSTSLCTTNLPSPPTANRFRSLCHNHKLLGERSDWPKGAHSLWFCQSGAQGGGRSKQHNASLGCFTAALFWAPPRCHQELDLSFDGVLSHRLLRHTIALKSSLIRVNFLKGLFKRMFNLGLNWPNPGRKWNYRYQ